MTCSSPQRSPTKHKNNKTKVIQDSESIDSISIAGDNSSSSSESHTHTGLLLERRLFSSRKTKRLDLSIASDPHTRARPPHALAPLQVFPRAIVAHEQVTSDHRLRELWLTNHHISVLPPDIAGLSQLKVLALAGNALTSLPPEIAQLTALESLYLERNQLRFLPESVVLPRQLRDLRLDHNALTNVPLQLTKLRLLQRLGLSHNRLTSLPQEMRRLVNLVELDVDHNELSSDAFPNDAIARLRHLERLGLDGNRLRERPPCLLRMPSVRYVRLNGNRRGTIDQDETAAVPRRHDGYFQCVDGYQATKAPSKEPLSSFSSVKRVGAPLTGLVLCQDQNLVNAMAYTSAANGSAIVLQ